MHAWLKLELSLLFGNHTDVQGLMLLNDGWLFISFSRLNNLSECNKSLPIMWLKDLDLLLVRCLKVTFSHAWLFVREWAIDLQVLHDSWLDISYIVNNRWFHLISALELEMERDLWHHLDIHLLPWVSRRYHLVKVVFILYKPAQLVDGLIHVSLRCFHFHG